jgi:hypothetical protein
MKKKTLPTSLIFCMLLAHPLFARDWYVRPAGGSYGSADGTSYSNAWNGLLKVVWGPGGVQAGDTLWVCGFHLFTYTGGFPYTGWATINVSGTAGSHITIRGDYPGDKGEVWGGCKLAHGTWVDEGNSTWSVTNRGGGSGTVLFEDVAPNGTFKLLTKASDLATCRSTPGSYYCSAYNSNTARLYVHCTDGLIPTNRITYERYGYRFKCNSQSYIDWLNLDFYGLYQAFWYGLDSEYVTYMNWTGCKLWHSTFYPAVGCHDLTFNGCDIAWALNGISVIGYMSGSPNITCYNLTIKNCIIHDIGSWPTMYDMDAHGISSQGDQTTISRNYLIEGNEIYNCGSGITFYIQSDTQSFRDVTVRYNFIHDSHQNGGANGRGIEYNMDGTNISRATSAIITS